MKYTSVSTRQLTGRKGKPWQARAKYKDAFGKWQETSKVLPDVKGKREANRMATEWLNALNAQAETMPNANPDDTVDKVYKKFIKHQLEIGEIERSTYSSNLHSYNKYIKPYLGNYEFATVDKTAIGIWITELYQLGLAQNTIHSTCARLKVVYNYFEDNGELLRNPFKGVKMPKKGEPKVTHLTSEQMENIIKCVYDNYEPENPMLVGILLAFYAGLRRGEICGLRWSDIDFDKHSITIRTAVGVSSLGGESESYTKNPKNRTSNRTFPIVEELEKALLRRKELISPDDKWFVIGDKDTFMRPQQYSRLFSEFVSRNDLVDAYGKKIVPHGLRHNFATVGIQSGMDIASLALMMGHASRAMTLDTYGDANADALTLASVKLTDTFKAKTDYWEEQVDKDKDD